MLPAVYVPVNPAPLWANKWMTASAGERGYVMKDRTYTYMWMFFFLEYAREPRISVFKKNEEFNIQGCRSPAALVNVNYYILKITIQRLNILLERHAHAKTPGPLALMWPLVAGNSSSKVSTYSADKFPVKYAS
jgi:hypothetical protein